MGFLYMRVRIAPSFTQLLVILEANATFFLAPESYIGLAGIHMTRNHGADTGSAVEPESGRQDARVGQP